MSSNSCLWILKSLLKLHLTRILFSKFPSPLEKLVSILTPCNYSSIPSPIAEIPYPRVTFVNEIAFIAGIPQERIPPRVKTRFYSRWNDGKKERKKERNRSASLKIFSSLSLSVFLLRSGQTRSILEITCPSTYLIHTHKHTRQDNSLLFRQLFRHPPPFQFTTKPVLIAP